MFAVSREFRLRECTDHDGTEFADVAHVNDALFRIERHRPTQGPIRLLLRCHYAEQILKEERCDHECVVRESSLAHDAVDLCLVGEMRDMELAATDRLDIRQRRPDEVLNAGIFRRVNGRECLLALVRARFPEIGYQKNPVCSGKRGFQCLRTIQIRQDDFVGQLRMLGRIASQGACFELTARLQRAHHGAALMTRCTDNGDELFGV